MTPRLLVLICSLFIANAFADEKAILETARRTNRSADEIRLHYIDGCASGITPHMNICAEYHYVKRDLRLNEVYQLLLAKFRDGDKAKAKLIKAQRAWVAFRDFTCDYESDGWSGGTGWGVVSLSCKSALTEGRIKKLEEYLECTAGCPGDGSDR